MQNPEVGPKLFKQLNHAMVLFWRLGFGQLMNAWPEVGGRILVMAHFGRKSGLRRQTPVNYALVGEEVYVTAGYGSKSDWYRNLLANPHVELWMPEGRWDGLAEPADESPERLRILREVLICSGFAAHLAGIDPLRIADAELEELVRDYRLLRIRLVQPRTGPHGPGDLAWVWPLATLVLAIKLLLRPGGTRHAG